LYYWIQIIEQIGQIGEVVTNIRVCFRSSRRAAREFERRRRDRGCRNSRLSTTDAGPPWSRRSRDPGAVAAIKAVGFLTSLGQQHPTTLLLGQSREPDTTTAQHDG